MKSWTKSLLAGTAVFALAASPALAQDAGGAGAGATGATGGATGTIDGTTGTTGATGTGAAGTGATGATGGAGTTGTTGTVDGVTGGAAGSDVTTHLLTQRGYTDIRPSEGAAAADGSAFTAFDTHGNKVEVVVNPATGEILRETRTQTKNQ